MDITYIPAVRAKWKCSIIPLLPRDSWKHLLEEAPLDPGTRDNWRMVEPLRDFLSKNEHKLTVDRGDFGDGDEHFYITFYSETVANDFATLCESLKKSG